MWIDNSCELSAWQTIHMTHQALFSQKIKTKKLECLLLLLQLVLEGLNEMQSHVFMGKYIICLSNFVFMCLQETSSTNSTHRFYREK